MGSNEMTDAEYLRWIAGVIRDGFDGVALVSPNRLTAIAAELDGGVIVPREPSDEWLEAFALELDLDSGYARGIHRAILTASEAK